MSAVVTSIVAGKPLDAEQEALTSENPARPDQPVGEFVLAGAAGVERAISTAVEASGPWGRRSALDRGAILRRAARMLDERLEEFAALLTAEEGKTLKDARGEVGKSVEILEYHASSAWWPTGETFHSSAGDLAYTVRVPLGVVAVITPWNFPVSIPVWKIAPALVHGNAVIWKPSSLTALLSARLAELLLEAGVDPGALSLVLGEGDVGAALVADERVDAVSFTGSERIGKQVTVAAATRGAKCQAELGGHNPAIVLADADIPLTVEALVRSIANQTGQKCTAARRIIADRPILDDLVDALRSRFGSLRVGDGADAGVDVGPLVTASAKSSVARSVQTAVAEGCELLFGGDRLDDESAFLQPTVLFAADQSPTICREEVFGPVSVVVPVDGVEQALSAAASTRFGLSAALFTRSEATARRFARDLPVGLLNINRPTTGTETHMPFGGTKASGTPGTAEQGMAAREFYTEVRSVFSNAQY